MYNGKVVYTKKTKQVDPSGINQSFGKSSVYYTLTFHTLITVTMQPTGNQERQKLDFEDDEARRERLGTCFSMLGNRDLLTIR
jgi:hypothetical protein